MKELTSSSSRKLLGVFGACYMLYFTGCGEQISKLQLDMRRVESSVNDLRNMQADQTTTLASLQNAVRALSGKLEEVEYSQNRRIGSDLTSLRQDLSSLKRRVPPPPIVPIAQLQSDEGVSVDWPAQVATAFDAAILKLREGAFTDALPLLQSAMDESYGDPRAAILLFWLGVAKEGNGDERGAIGSYNELTTKFARHPRVPVTYLRIASVLLRLRDTQTAKLMLQKLVTDFPKSAEAQAAREKLQDL